jgi:formylmethanofuran dehydrogenase subunit E
MAEIREIGRVRSKFTDLTDPFVMRKEQSTIVIDPEFAEGLYDIESNRYLQILFHFHQSTDYKLQSRWYFGDRKGVFSSRSPKRPGAIGLTTVELIRREGAELIVKGLDALDGTPVLDIKPLSVGADFPKAEELQEEFKHAHPRSGIIPLIKTGDQRRLLSDAGILHGHYCPGLSLGVSASYHAMKELSQLLDRPLSEIISSGGLEELISVVEVNSCFADGVQHVTGCTLGNNALIYKDLGKTAVTCALRGESDGIRISVKPGLNELLDEIVPEFGDLFEKVVKQNRREQALLSEFKKASLKASFGLLDIPPSRLFKIEKKQAVFPDYAQMKESMICSSCLEEVMENKRVGTLCRTCAEKAYYLLDGSGIRKGGMIKSNHKL